MPSLSVCACFITGFFKAVNTFLYQLVYDPMQRRVVPLNPYPDDVTPSELHYAGPYPCTTYSVTCAVILCVCVCLCIRRIELENTGYAGEHH